MGKGKQKQTVKTKPDKKKTGGKKWGQTTKERNIIKRDVFITDEIKKSMDEDVPKMREITISKLSMKYNIVQSIVKKYLEDLHKQKKIKLITRTSRLSIYTSLETESVPIKKAVKAKKEKPTKAKAEPKPKKETKVEEKPKKEAKAESKPKKEAKVEEKPKKEEKAEEKPKKAAKVKKTAKAKKGAKEKASDSKE